MRQGKARFDWAWWLVHLAGLFTVAGSIVGIVITEMWPIFAGFGLTITGWVVALRNA